MFNYRPRARGVRRALWIPLARGLLLLNIFAMKPAGFTRAHRPRVTCQYHSFWRCGYAKCEFKCYHWKFRYAWTVLVNEWVSIQKSMHFDNMQIQYKTVLSMAWEKMGLSIEQSGLDITSWMNVTRTAENMVYCFVILQLCKSHLLCCIAYILFTRMLFYIKLMGSAVCLGMGSPVFGVIEEINKIFICEVFWMNENHFSYLHHSSRHYTLANRLFKMPCN